MPKFRLVRAVLSDLPFIMTTERREGYEALVGQWREDAHREAFSDGRHAYFLGQIDNDPIGFAIVRDWASSERVTLVKRIAVCEPGRGLGRQLLRTLVQRIFQETDAHRIWLGVFPENLRARRAYEAVGFIPEGKARGTAFFGGAHKDELIMAILRTDEIKIAD